ncbi:hypothetical protein N2152v2_011085 [Parachlorella kessleri]
MLARALSRACSKASPLASSLQRSAAALEPTCAFGGSSAWRSVYSFNEGGRWLVAGPWRDQEEDRERKPGDRQVHTAAALLRADTSNVPPGQGGSTINDPDATAREAGRPTGGGPPVDAGASGTSYMLLSAAHAGLAATAFLAPTMLVNAFFPGAALPQGMQLQVLSKILACGLGAGSAASLALKQAADSGDLASPTAQRLQLGLMGFSAGAISMHLLYSPAITFTSLAMGAAVMGTTFAVPYSHYTKTNGGLGLGSVVGSYLGAVPDHLNIKNAQSALYALVTPTLALAGASYLFMPEATLGHVFGYARGIESMFLWQNIGGGLMTVAPAITYSLKKAADEGTLGHPMYKTLNAGLALAAAGHLVVLGPMWAAGQGGPMLPWILGAWSTALLTSGLGLMKGGAAKAATA